MRNVELKARIAVYCPITQQVYTPANTRTMAQTRANSPPLPPAAIRLVAMFPLVHSVVAGWMVCIVVLEVRQLTQFIRWLPLDVFVVVLAHCALHTVARAAPFRNDHTIIYHASLRQTRSRGCRRSTSSSCVVSPDKPTTHKMRNEQRSVNRQSSTRLSDCE